MSQVPAGMSKVFILDKYFNELQKFWDTEKRLKGKQSQIFFKFNFSLSFERSENRVAFLPSEAINVYSLECIAFQLWTPKDFLSYEKGFNDFSWNVWLNFVVVVNPY